MINPRIYVAGHRGMVGSAIVRALERRGYTNLIVRTHCELDLTDQSAVHAFFHQERPEYVFVAAAKVGGIYANNAYPAEFIRENIAIQTNVIHESWQAGTSRLLFLGSSCIYPRDCPQPIKEEYLLTGPLEPTNRPYAIAKIAGIEMCASYNRQYGTRFLAAMPTNLYGPGDNYHPENSHVIPALIRRFHEARASNAPSVAVWGTGSPRREFLHCDDLADACLFLMELPDSQFLQLVSEDGRASPVINIGAGRDITIRALAEKIAQLAGYDGDLVFDPAYPDGTPVKLLDNSRLHTLGWHARISLDDGLASTCASFRAGRHQSSPPSPNP